MNAANIGRFDDLGPRRRRRPRPPETMPGGGRIGAVLLNRKWIRPGSVDTTGRYNHYSALRTYEDLPGLHQGGADGRGHLGFAARATAFGADVFTTSPRWW